MKSFSNLMFLLRKKSTARINIARMGLDRGENKKSRTYGTSDQSISYQRRECYNMNHQGAHFRIHEGAHFRIWEGMWEGM